MTGLRASQPDQVDSVITQMLETPGPVIVDMVVSKEENCLPMIPGGAAHNEILLGLNEQKEQTQSEDGMVLV
jgi:acetolactate synthase-1/2/3 large subunit